MRILGLSALEHDSAAALLDEQGVRAAIEEDKLARTPAVGGIPRLAIEQCARLAGVSLLEIPVVAMASHPQKSWQREERFRLGLLLSRPRAAFGTGAAGRIYHALQDLRELRRMFDSRTRWLHYEHHLCHAAGAFFGSAAERALVLTLDEAGDMWSGLVAMGEGETLQPLRPLRFPNSLGWFYSRITEMLGFRAGSGEHKTQWLSKDGTPRYLPGLRKVFRRSTDGLPELDRKYFGEGHRGRWGIAGVLARELDLIPEAVAGNPALRADLARSAQEWLEETVVELAEAFRKKSGATELCLGGGVFLNVMLVRALETRTGFQGVHVQPVAGNPGTALGAAFLAQRELGEAPKRQELRHVYFGPEFGSDQIKAVLDNCKVIYRYYRTDTELFDAAVELLREEKIVAWYQGRVEFGLRALGNRSILASPFSPYVVENLNQFIKHREDFHPFALSVPLDDAPGIFDCSPNCRFMASIATLKAKVPGLEKFAFNGTNVRVNTVEREVNPRFHALLKRFGAGQPAPVLVNTSFNLFGEPLVCDPREAIRSFYCSGIDAMVMGSFLIVK